MNPDDIRLNNEGVLSRCKQGHLLEFPRVKISHWGVYAGDGKVIHVQVAGNGCSSGSLCCSQSSTSGEKMGKAQIKEDSFWDVAGSSVAKINNYLDVKKAALPGQEIVKRARQKVGEVGYNLLWNNCEHFATYCRYGEGISEQVQDCINFLNPCTYIKRMLSASECSKK